MNKNIENFRRQGHWITGEVQDKIIDKDGNVTVLPVDHNLVVDSCSNLIACLFKDSGESGIRYWAIGGVLNSKDSWDEKYNENTSGAQTKLKQELYRFPITSDDIKFVDKDGNETKGIITNRIKITVTVKYDEGNGTWYEFGLFGGNSASETKDSGIMINRKVHEPISKTVNLQIQRTVIFTF
jgi:hypothetical protein